jgi:hypothetical protein
MTSAPISGADYAALFGSFRVAFRMEDQEEPLAFEQDAYARFLAGSPPEPGEWAEWQGWLDRVREMTAHGKLISRVAIISDPPTPYQRWRIWGARWHREAGEGIRFLACGEAAALGITRPCNWWLFDGKQAVTSVGTSQMRLITGTSVRAFCRSRDLAVRHAADMITA